MKINVENLGILKSAEFELGDLTIICGENNTGKTYATYATYGFINFWENEFEIDIKYDQIENLLKKGSIDIDIVDYTKLLKTYIKRASKEYSTKLYTVFGAPEKAFENSKFEIELDSDDTYLTEEMNVKVGSTEKAILQIKKETNSKILTISLLVDSDSESVLPAHIIKNVISDAMKRVLCNKKIPKVFIASVERTGAAIFQKELDFTRNRIVELLGNNSDKLSPVKLLGSFSGGYPIPVRENVDIVRNAREVAKKEGFLQKKHTEILDAFEDILNGKFIITKDGEVQYIPNQNKNKKLTLIESSSSVRSLVSLFLYLWHVAKPGDLLIIDEPELNLHPRNQRAIARLFARLVNIGIKVFITTHSDYIVKEFNTLIMLNTKTEIVKKVAKEYDYTDMEFLNPNRIRSYVAKQDSILFNGNKRKTKCNTLVNVNINKNLGIELDTFDDSIERINKIQDAITWG